MATPPEAANAARGRNGGITVPVPRQKIDIGSFLFMRAHEAAIVGIPVAAFYTVGNIAKQPGVASKIMAAGAIPVFCGVVLVSEMILIFSAVNLDSDKGPFGWLYKSI